MEISNIIPHVESLIFASDKPLTSIELTELLNNAFGFMDNKITLDQVEAAVEGVVEKYHSEFYPFEVKQSGGGWQFLTKKDYHKTVAQLNGDKFLKRLSAAALETLAIIAYKQPITKGEIEAIRGVNSDYTVAKLLEKELVVISGRNEKLPGHPLVYATSKNFMDYFGINSAEELPQIREVLADQVIEPTLIRHTEFEEGSDVKIENDTETEDEKGYLVSENGELLSESEGGEEAEENNEDQDEIEVEVEVEMEDDESESNFEVDEDGEDIDEPEAEDEDDQDEDDEDDDEKREG